MRKEKRNKAGRGRETKEGGGGNTKTAKKKRLEEMSFCRSGEREV